MKNLKILVLLMTLMSIFGCTSVPLQRTTELKPGMSIEEVKGILGEPYSASLDNEIYVLNYHLQYYLNGSYPYLEVSTVFRTQG